MELEVENESSVGDTDVSIPQMEWRWKVWGWLRSQECRHSQQNLGVGGARFRLGGEMGRRKAGSHGIISQQEGTRGINAFVPLNTLISKSFPLCPSLHFTGEQTEVMMGKK